MTLISKKKLSKSYSKMSIDSEEYLASTGKLSTNPVKATIPNNSVIGVYGLLFKQPFPRSTSTMLPTPKFV